METVFSSVEFDPRLYNEYSRPAELGLRDSLDDWEEMVTASQLSVETPTAQDMSLWAEELNWGIEASEFLGAVQRGCKSVCEEKIICVL
jgi:hypothetical protein